MQILINEMNSLLMTNKTNHKQSAKLVQCLGNENSRCDLKYYVWSDFQCLLAVKYFLNNTNHSINYNQSRLLKRYFDEVIIWHLE